MPEEDQDVVREHLDGCANCRLFSEQLDETSTLLDRMSRPEEVLALDPDADSDELYYPDFYQGG